MTGAARVLVTRASEDAAPLVRRLQAAGLVAPTAAMVRREIDADAVRAGVARTPRPDVLLLTSATAARTLAGHDVRPGRVVCVGPATERAARAVGLAVDHIGEGTGADVVHAAVPDGATVLWVCAERAVPGTVHALRDVGAVVTEVAAYRTVPHPDAAARLAEAGPVDLVTLTAPSIARSYADARRLVPDHGTPGVVVLGPSTAEAARAVALDVVDQADPPTLDALVRAVIRASTSR